MAEEKSVYRLLSEKIMAPTSELIPRLFAMLADEGEAQMLLALPATAAQLAGKFGISEQQATDKMQDFFIKGMVFKSKKPEGVRYRLCRDLVQFHDATILWPEATSEYYDLWQQFMEEEWPEYSKFVEGFFPKPVTRIIPVNQSLSSGAQVLAYESCKDIIDTTSRIALTKCTCRLTAKKCDRPVEVCLQLGKAADYTLERGTGREISREQALDIIRECEEVGLMHVTMNKSDNMHFICNCCGDCCITMPVMIKYGRKLTDPSRFTARVDADACEACGECEGRCYFSAITMTGSDEDEHATVDEQTCMGCGICQVTCPSGAISLVEVREKEFIPLA